MTNERRMTPEEQFWFDTGRAFEASERGETGAPWEKVKVKLGMSAEGQEADSCRWVANEIEKLKDDSDYLRERSSEWSHNIIPADMSPEEAYRANSPYVSQSEADYRIADLEAEVEQLRRAVLLDIHLFDPNVRYHAKVENHDGLPPHQHEVVYPRPNT